jgi:hypothetical protein
MSVLNYDRACGSSAHDVVCCRVGNGRRRAARHGNCDNQEMRNTDKQLDDFIQRWANAFNETLTPVEAQVGALQLDEFFRLVGKRSPKTANPKAPLQAENADVRKARSGAPV